MPYTNFFARLLLVIFFLFSAYGKIIDFEGTVALARNVRIPLPEIAIVLAIIFEVVGSLLILIGKKFAGTGAVILIVFMMLATFFFHNFWAVPPEQTQMQLIQFFKNVAIIGGLFLIFEQFRYQCPLYVTLHRGEKKNNNMK